jgi:ribonuclease BN (tRNA processing enzyme)
LRITVLGKSPAWQDAGGACSGYLVEQGETRLLVDCGNGVFAKLRERLDYVDVTGVVLTHMHADHCLDVVPFAYALTYSPRQQPVPVAGYPGTDLPARPHLLTPRGGVDVLRHLSGLWGNDALVDAAFATQEYAHDDVVELGDLQLRFALVPHYIPTFAIEVTPLSGGPRCVFGADCSPNEEIVAFAAGSDLLILEATLPRPERDGIRGHLTAEEAGEHAKRARALRLVLTHISDELDPDEARRRANAAFGKDVAIATEGAIYEI